MIVLTLLNDHNPIKEWEFEDEDFEKANEVIATCDCLPSPLWVDIDLEEAEHVRECSICGKLMDEGFYDDGTYYCSSDCLSRDYPTVEEWDAHCEENEEAYWTTWYE